MARFLRRQRCGLSLPLLQQLVSILLILLAYARVHARAFELCNAACSVSLGLNGRVVTRCVAMQKVAGSNPGWGQKLLTG